MDFSRGGTNQTSDSVPVMLSVGEAVVNAPTVQALGGAEGVQQMIDENVDYVSETLNRYRRS